MHSLRTPVSQICLPSARISSCASARHCQIILRPESCKYGLPIPDVWTFALRKSTMLAMLSKFGRVYRSDLWQQVDGEGTQVPKNT